MENKPRIEVTCCRNSRDELIKHLIIDNIIWMSNDDIEYLDINRSLKFAHGTCYIGGLGLGLVANECAKIEAVEKVIVVEIDKNIIKLVKPTILNNKIHIYQGDATKDFHNMRYDWAYFDIWVSLDRSAKELMMKCFNNIKPFLKPNAILEAWGKTRLEVNDFTF